MLRNHNCNPKVLPLKPIAERSSVLVRDNQREGVVKTVANDTTCTTVLSCDNGTTMRRNRAAVGALEPFANITNSDTEKTSTYSKGFVHLNI